MLMPLLLTIIIATVFGTIFNMPMGDYMPYILSGLVVWDLVIASAVGGSNAIMGSEQYIRQVSHPLIIYTLKGAIVSSVTFLIAVISLVIWVSFINPVNALTGIATLPITLLVLLPLSWAIITFAALVNTKYRDYPQITALVVQILWFLSPVFFQREMFLTSPALTTWFSYNPIAHLLDLVREPFLFGRMPSLQNYAFSIAFVLFWVLIAVITHKRMKSNVIFYL